ncbi:MAG: ParA family protein [Alphaproteobacteria bacterium]|nr:ParA family protein [Alphaproteobacteria bacterium]
MAFPSNDTIAEVKKTRIIAIANQKGGVGKTTTAINLATAMAELGLKILVIDLDPQGNASTGVGVDRQKRFNGSYHVLIGEKGLDECIHKTEIKNLDILPSDMDLAGAEVELVGMQRREYRLRDALKGNVDEYDMVFVDCPPSLGFITVNSLVAADSVIVPLQCEFFALEGVSHLMRTIKQIKKVFNPYLNIQGIVLTMFDKRSNLSDLVAKDVRSFFKDRVYKTVIPRNVRVSEAPSHGVPVLVYDKKCAGTNAYKELAQEIVGKEGINIEDLVA